MDTIPALEIGTNIYSYFQQSPAAGWVALNLAAIPVDFSVGKYTHYKLWGRCYTYPSPSYYHVQLAQLATPSIALSGSSPDLVVPAVLANYDSGWRQINPPLSGLQQLCLAFRAFAGTPWFRHYGFHITLCRNP